MLHLRRRSSSSSPRRWEMEDRREDQNHSADAYGLRFCRVLLEFPRARCRRRALPGSRRRRPNQLSANRQSGLCVVFSQSLHRRHFDRRHQGRGRSGDTWGHVRAKRNHRLSCSASLGDRLGRRDLSQRCVADCFPNPRSKPRPGGLPQRGRAYGRHRAL